MRKKKHNIWQVTFHTMLYESIIHHIFYFLHTQHMACDVPHHALSHTAPPVSSTHNIWHVTLHSMLYESITHHIFHFPHTHDIWQVTLHKMFYHTLNPFILHTQHMARNAPHHALREYHAPHRPFFTYTTYAGDALHHALWQYHAQHPSFSTHTTYGRWRSTPCSTTHCIPTSSMHTSYGR